jgi:large subunit ribosomal protein L34
MTKRTYQPKKLKRKRKHGFLAKNSTKSGRAVMKKRQLKGRARIALT